ncbi:MAG: glycosyltransferase family 2 protein [Verrucomicrobia bacterium]|nr:glycosyltransferase family 2 protein [Verrucomicrobiota bacterium]
MMRGFLFTKLTFLIVLVFPFLIHSEEKPFVVVITSHNNKSWYQHNLDSVFSQNYRNYRIIYISDGSTDGSDLLIENYIRESGEVERVSLYKNQVRKGQLACACQAIFSCKKNEIVVELDGSNWLAHRDVLSTLNAIYADPDVWMTYGQFISYPDYSFGLGEPIHQEMQIRSLPDGVVPLRSFYASLFQAIRKGDFLDEGKFLPASDGGPYLVPILEMAGNHSRFIPDVLYIWNKSAAEHQDDVLSELDNAISDKMQKMPKYSALPKLPSISSREDTPHGMVYRQIKDIYHPTLEDYRLVHNYLFYGNRPNLERVGDLYYWGQRTIRIIGDSPDQIPKTGIVHVNSNGEEKENCVILYSTYNRSYPQGLARLLNCIAQSDFKGDVLYRVGGWPDEEGGSLLLSHVPYAFKPSFFKEAQQLGYKRILWLDTAVVPVASLNEVFAMMKDKGCFVMGNVPMIGPFMNAHAAAYFGLTMEDTYKIPSCSSGLFGVDLSQKVCRDLLDNWYRAAQDPDAFFSTRPDQNTLSILLYQSDITEFIDIRRMPHAEVNEQIQPDSLFYLDRLYIR